MIFRVALGYPKAFIENYHGSMFFETIAAHHDIVATWEQRCGDYDFVLNSSQRGIHGKIWIGAYDPHGAPLDMDGESLVDPIMYDLLGKNEREILRGDFHNLRNQTVPAYGPVSSGQLQKQEYTAISYPHRWPWTNIAFPPELARMWTPLAPPEAIFYAPPEGTNRRTNVFFLGAACSVYSPLRVRVLREIDKIDPSSIVTWQQANGTFHTTHCDSIPCAPPEWSDYRGWQRQLMWYADRLRDSKIMPFDGSVFNIHNNKFFEVMACGCLAMAPMPHDGHLLGLRDGYNFVVIGPNDYADKIRYYLAHDYEREEIARRGVELVMRRHTIGCRVRDLVAKMKRIAAGVPIPIVEADADAAMQLASETDSCRLA